MFTTTLVRLGGKWIKNFGWWQLLVLGGLCAWATTPVDAQQGGYQSYNSLLPAWNQNEGDDFPQPRGHSRPASPLNENWGTQSQVAPQPMPPSVPWQDNGSIERIDVRPNRYNDGWGIGNSPSMNTPVNPWSGDSAQFIQPRRRGWGGHGSNYRGSDFLNPAQQSPAFQSPQPLDPGFTGTAPRNQQGPAFPNVPENSRAFQTPGYSSQGYQTPGQQGPAYPAPNYQTPGFQNPAIPNTLPRTMPQEQVTNPAQEIQTRISRRYQTPGFVSLLNLPPQQSIALYTEVMQMIDTRHLEPATPQARVQKGLTNLIYALDNPAFVHTNQLMLQPQMVQGYRMALQQAMQTPVQSTQDAASVLNWTMQMSQQQIGLRPAATALEFVYGAVESLDKYSAFVPPERSPGASLQLESKLVGIGVQIEMQDKGAEVSKVIKGSPAQTAGVQAGDMLLAVSGKELAGLTVDQTVELISGPEGSPVVLGIERNGQAPFTLTVTRQPFQLHAVNDVQILGGTQVGYFKLEKFTETSTAEVENALQQLYQQGAQSLVMDLRGNPGGLLTAAIQISDKFLPQGTIVATRGRNPSDNTEEHATREHTWKIPLVVLVDHNSASASEIFAAAIQENRRGVVVGRTSYGKGTVQTQFPLQTAGCSLRITTAKFYSPSGRVMAGSGVTPDVQIPENQAGNQAGYGVMDQDVIAAVNVAQRGNSMQNQNLSGLQNFSQPRIPQPFAQPQFAPFGR